MKDNNSEGNNFYKTWHKDPRHKVLHWAAFVAIAVLSTNILMTHIQEFAMENNLENDLSNNTAAALISNAKSLNMRFEDARIAYQEKGSSKEENELVDIAKQRQKALVALARENPQSALEAVLSEEELKELPPSVLKNMEKLNVKLNGIYRKDHAEMPGGGMVPAPMMETSTGNYYLFSADGKFPEGHGVQATLEKGVQVDNVVIVAAGSNINTQTGAVVTPTAPGVHKIAVMIINGAASTDYVRGEFATMNAHSLEQSYNKTSIVADIFQVTTSAGCYDYYKMADEADAAIKAQGASITNYTNSVYIAGECPFAGIGQMPGKRSWIAEVGAGVMAHELGHNEGPNHAATMGDEYGEQEDVMGNARAVRNYNAPHRNQVGWIPSTNVLNITAPGTYTVGTTEILGSEKQLLKINIDSRNSYYASLRQSFGTFDAGIGEFVAIHKWTSAPTSALTILQSNLSTGQNFTDPQAGVSLTLKQISGSNATVEVTFTCNPGSPSVQIDPAYSTFPNQPLAFTAYITNKDSFRCPTSSTFNISSSLPVGWTMSSIAPITLAPQTAVSVSGTINPGSASIGAYPISLNVVDASNSAHGGSGNTTINIEAPDSVPPVISLSPAEGAIISGSKLTIYGNAYDPAPSQGMKSITISFDGVVRKTCTTFSSQCSYAMAASKVSRGAHTISSTAVDKNGNTTTVTHNVTK